MSNLIQLSFTNFYVSAHVYDDTDMPRGYASLDEKQKYMIGDTCLANKLKLSERNSMVEKGQRKFLYYSESGHSYVEIICKPSEALKYIVLRPSSVVNSALEIFSLPIEDDTPADDEPRPIKDYDAKDKGVLFLQSIIKECPNVVVERPAYVKPKDLRKQIADHFKKTKEANYSTIDLLYKFKKAFRMLERAFSDCGKAEAYQYPVTYEQYAALSLMQTYGSPYNSCQYLPLHSFSMDNIVSYVHGNYNYDFREQMNDESPNYCIDQADDFNFGFCDRFFVLNSKGFVEKRFSVHNNLIGERLLSNFYNCTPVTSLKIGGTTVENVLRSTAIDFKESGASYVNNYYSTIDSALGEIGRVLG